MALKKLAEDAASRANLTLEMPDIIMVPPLLPDVEQCIYRIAQEAIANIIKHASAKKMTVKLEFINSQAKLTISDDGTGFNPDIVDKTSHFGLAGIQERALLVNGELKITSKAGHGTTIELTIIQAVRS
jgi:signal transduction histidine kinase